MFLFFFFGKKRLRKTKTIYKKNRFHKTKTAGEEWGVGNGTPTIDAKLTGNKSQLHFSLSINIILINVNKVHKLFCTEQRPSNCSQGNQVLHCLKPYLLSLLDILSVLKANQHIKLQSWTK